MDSRVETTGVLVEEQEREGQGWVRGAGCPGRACHQGRQGREAATFPSHCSRRRQEGAGRRPRREGHGGHRCGSEVGCQRQAEYPHGPHDKVLHFPPQVTYPRFCFLNFLHSLESFLRKG